MVQFLRPTASLIVYLQAIGRGLRVEPGKPELIVLDQVANWQRHGLPDDDREWSLAGQTKSRKQRRRGTANDSPVSGVLLRLSGWPAVVPRLRHTATDGQA